MLITFFRSIVLYIIVLIVMRLMGKREIGELQPFELVIAIMIADLASVPMSDTGVPISNGIIPILALLLLQLVISIFNLKSMKIRQIMCGVPSILIFIFERIKFSELKKEFLEGNKKAIFITAISWSFSIIAQLRAYQLGDVGVVAPLCALTVILNVIVGYFTLKEKDNILKKIVAALLIVFGVVLIRI